MNDAEYWKACLLASHEATDLGVYCAGVYEKDGSFKKRTEWQDGWNAAVETLIEKFFAFYRKCEEATPEWKMKVLLLAADQAVMEPDGSNFAVIVSDIFAWACADAEDVSDEDLPEVFAAHEGDKDWGIIKWVCHKRNQQPQRPIVEQMKKRGAWDDAMEALPANYYDTQCAARAVQGTSGQSVQDCPP